MTLAVDNRVTSEQVADGVTKQFNYDFPIFFSDESREGIQVRFVTDTEFNVVDEGEYTVIQNTDNTGGYIQFTTAPTKGAIVQIVGNTSVDQQLDLTNGGRFSAEAIETNFDKLVAIMQEWYQKLSDEEKLRVANDLSLSNRITLNAQDIANEIALRISSDQNLQNQINSNKLSIEQLNNIVSEAINNGTSPNLAVFSVNSIDDLNSLKKWDGRTVVTLSGKVGLFKYDSSQASVNNGFSVINGWVRLITGNNDSIPISWFVEKDSDVSAILPLGYNFDIDIDCYVKGEVNLTKDNQHITGLAKITIPSKGTFIKLLGQYQTFDVNSVFSNDADYCIYENGYNNLITNINFTGKVGNYVLSSGTFCNIYRCHQVDNQQITPFVIDGGKLSQVKECTLSEYHGFGIQFRWAYYCKMINNRSKSPIYKYELNVVSGQTDYVFTTDKAYSRTAVMAINTDGTRYTIQSGVTNVNNTYNVTLQTALTTGKVQLLLCDSLETYQINSGCVGCEIIENISDGTGDSNAVVGADYYNSDGKGTWILNPDLVTLADYPIHSVVRGNTLINAFFANIAINNSNKFVTIEGNHTGDAGMYYDQFQAHDSNILCSFDGVITKNTFNNTGNYTLSCIASYKSASSSYNENQGGLTITDDNQLSGFKTIDSRNTAQRALLMGASSEAVIRRQGTTLTGGNWKTVKADLQTIFEADFVNDMPVATADWGFGNLNGSLYKDTTDRVSGKNSVLINSNTVVIDISANDQLKAELSNKIIKVRGSFKGTGKLSIFPLFAGALTSGLELAINSTKWVTQEIVFPTTELTTFLLRMQGGAFKMQNIEILYKDIP